MEKEIIEYVYHEIKSTGLEKKLIAGIVLTGGGSMLKHIEQLTQFMTAMDTRIGYPNEHLASTVPEEITSPMYATGVGLVMLGLQRNERHLTPSNEQVQEGDPATETPVKQPKKKPGGKGLMDWFNKFFEEGID